MTPRKAVRGRTVLEVATGKGTAKRAKPRHLEAIEQRLFVRRWRMDPRTRDRLACAVPNGGKRGIREAALMKAEGVERGVPDWLLLEPSGVRPDLPEWWALAIEFKSPDRKGRLSVDQMRWHNGLRENGWQVRVVTSAAEAWAAVADYLGFRP
jgi:hypothetical protein